MGVGTQSACMHCFRSTKYFLPFFPNSRTCDNGNNQRLILYSEAETQIQVAGTKFCLDVGSCEC